MPWCQRERHRLYDEGLADRRAPIDDFASNAAIYSPKPRRMEDRSRWIVLIKNLRVEHSCGIIDAERIALADPAWRRWVERQINNDKTCRRMVLRHIRYNGEGSLLGDDGDALRVR